MDFLLLLFFVRNFTIETSKLEFFLFFFLLRGLGHLEWATLFLIWIQTQQINKKRKQFFYFFSFSLFNHFITCVCNVVDGKLSLNLDAARHTVVVLLCNDEIYLRRRNEEKNGISDDHALTEWANGKCCLLSSTLRCDQETNSMLFSSIHFKLIHINLSLFCFWSPFAHTQTQCNWCAIETIDCQMAFHESQMEDKWVLIVFHNVVSWQKKAPVMSVACVCECAVSKCHDIKERIH